MKAFMGLLIFPGVLHCTTSRLLSSADLWTYTPMSAMRTSGCPRASSLKGLSSLSARFGAFTLSFFFFGLGFVTPVGLAGKFFSASALGMPSPLRVRIMSAE
jgi:hypothetical protein